MNEGRSQVFKTKNRDFYLVMCNSLLKNGGVKDILYRIVSIK